MAAGAFLNGKYMIYVVLVSKCQDYSQPGHYCPKPPEIYLFKLLNFNVRLVSHSAMHNDDRSGGTG